jgi:hypothetical protein
MTREQKLELLKHIYTSMGNREIAKLLNMNYALVRYYALKFGLKKNPNVLEDQLSERVEKSIQSRRERDLRENALKEKTLTYWERVNEFKKDQFETHGRFHPFYKLQIKTQANG